MDQLIQETREIEDKDNSSTDQGSKEICTKSDSSLIKKSIAKNTISKKDKFKKCKFIITPIIDNRYIFNHKFMIFGYIQVETQYKDFQDPYDHDLINMGHCQFKVRQVEKRQNYQQIKIHFNNSGYSGIKDFKFLIDQLSTIPDQRYKELELELRKYQDVCSRQVSHFKELKSWIQCGILTEESYSQTMCDFEKYSQEYIKQNYTESDFVFSSFICVNYNTQDYETRNITLSYALLSLLGIEPGQGDQELLHSSIYFEQALGIERLIETLGQLRMLNNDSYKQTYSQTLLTADCISFPAKFNIEFIQWPDQPYYLKRYDFMYFVAKIDVSLASIKSIVEIRSKQTNEELANLFYPKIEYLFEYSIQSEIFLEKFYPSLYNQQKNDNLKNNVRKSLTLRQLNKQLYLTS